MRIFECAVVHVAIVFSATDYFSIIDLTPKQTTMNVSTPAKHPKHCFDLAPAHFASSVLAPGNLLDNEVQPLASL